MIVAHLANEELKCPGCGGYMDETLEKDHAYKVHENVCNKCNAIGKYNEKYRKEEQPHPGKFTYAERIELDQL